jgi:hypothetical protein
MSMYAARGWADGFNTVLFIGIQPEFNNYFFRVDSSAIISFLAIQATLTHKYLLYFDVKIHTLQEAI